MNGLHVLAASVAFHPFLTLVVLWAVVTVLRAARELAVEGALLALSSASNLLSPLLRKGREETFVKSPNRAARRRAARVREKFLAQKLASLAKEKFLAEKVRRARIVSLRRKAGGDVRSLVRREILLAEKRTRKEARRVETPCWASEEVAPSRPRKVEEERKARSVVLARARRFERLFHLCRAGQAAARRRLEGASPRPRKVGGSWASEVKDDLRSQLILRGVILPQYFGAEIAPRRAA